MVFEDDDVMYAYEGAFSIDEVQEWLNRQINRYKEYGFGLWAVVLKETGVMIGQCGVTMQDYKSNKVMEVGSLLQKEHWHHGYIFYYSRYKYTVTKRGNTKWNDLYR